MRKHLRRLLCGALLVAALFTFSAFTTAPAGMNPHTAHAAPATTMSPSYTCPLPVIQWGGNNPAWAVKLLQQSLNWWYYHSDFKNYTANAPLAEDGILGGHTENAIWEFQGWDSNATGGADGIVGPRTWHALGHC